MAYQVGDLVRVTGAFTTAAGVATDPAAVVGKYRDPSGNTVSLTYGVDAALVRDGVGVYHIDINANQADWWFYRFYSTGTGQAASEGKFYVEPSRF